MNSQYAYSTVNNNNNNNNQDKSNSLKATLSRLEVGIEYTILTKKYLMNILI